MYFMGEGQGFPVDTLLYEIHSPAGISWIEDCLGMDGMDGSDSILVPNVCPRAVNTFVVEIVSRRLFRVSLRLYIREDIALAHVDHTHQRVNVAICNEPRYILQNLFTVPDLRLLLFRSP